MMVLIMIDVWFFFFNDTATTEIYTLSLHDALPISGVDLDEVRRPERYEHCHDKQPTHPRRGNARHVVGDRQRQQRAGDRHQQDRKSTRLNSSHANISYAVFCLKKKKHSRN